MRNIYVYFLTAVFTLIIVFSCHTNNKPKEIGIITVDAGDFDRENSFVVADLSGLDFDLNNNKLVLYEINRGTEILVASQFDVDGGSKLYWKLTSSIKAKESHNFSLRLEPQIAREKVSAVQVIDVHGNLIVKVDGKNVLQYNFNEAPLPEGVPEVYNRAGYIHPLWSPKGEVLTRIQPPDHHHHVGIWNPWTHTEYKGKIIDFWNLVKEEGTVKPTSISSTISNDVFGGFKVNHDHIDLKASTSDGSEVALKEEWNVKVWNVSEEAWLIDVVSTMKCATNNAFIIKEYRYQGFGFRATEKWDDKTANLLTSEGKNKENGNSTRARWCDVNGVSDFGTSGVLFITHPSNYNYPEPIRIWPVGANEGKENVFFNFNPSMDRDWVLEPGNEYQLKYRMFVYDGKIDKSKAEKLWQDFAYPPNVHVEPVAQ